MFCCTPAPTTSWLPFAAPRCAAYRVPVARLFTTIRAVPPQHHRRIPCCFFVNTCRHFDWQAQQRVLRIYSGYLPRQILRILRPPLQRRPTMAFARAIRPTPRTCRDAGRTNIAHCRRTLCCACTVIAARLTPQLLRHYSAPIFGHYLYALAACQHQHLSPSLYYGCPCAIFRRKHRRYLLFASSPRACAEARCWRLPLYLEEGGVHTFRACGAYPWHATATSPAGGLPRTRCRLRRRYPR